MEYNYNCACGCGCGCLEENNSANTFAYGGYCQEQKHVHEIVGSVEKAGGYNCCIPCHNHRFATVSCEAIPLGCDHVHEVKFRTDFYEGHYHEFCGKTGGAIDVGNGRHVHYLEDCTSNECGHNHRFRVATLIENPIGDC